MGSQKLQRELRWLLDGPAVMSASGAPRSDRTDGVVTTIKFAINLNFNLFYAGFQESHFLISYN